MRELVSAERRPQYAAHGKRGVAGNKIAAAGSGVIADTGNGDTFAASGLVVSTTTFCVAVCPTFPARSTTRTV
ncbi:hypothetical protein ECZU03_36650 [Escherichia coli]|nr:hypothetical protein ECZU03_36650 [Escherichia coli]